MSSILLRGTKTICNHTTKIKYYFVLSEKRSKINQREIYLGIKLVMDVIIYHNPRCSKSRLALEIIRNKKIEPRVIEYLKTGFSKEVIKNIINKLNLDIMTIIRPKDAKKIGLELNSMSEKELIEAIIDQPSLIERPIIIKGKKAIIARPSEKVLEII